MPDPVDPKYAERFEAFINQANSYLPETHAARVGMSMADASARFYAWLWAMSNPDAATMQSKRAEAVEGFTRQAREMFELHFDTYVREYDSYINRR